jgi:adenosyl cobinamide kinase/adenosyl cobinamide phosphate guanylyltransferase
MLTLLVGGVRSGKSTLALRIAARGGANVTFVATAEPFDDDMTERIDRHRAERPAEWSTIEAPLHLAAAIRSVPPDRVVIVDCLTVWMGTLFHLVPDPSTREAMVADVCDALASRCDASTVVVSNEVGMGVHPETDLGRRYRDELGRANQQVAALADEVLLCVAGRTLRLDAWT